MHFMQNVWLRIKAKSQHSPSLQPVRVKMIQLSDEFLQASLWALNYAEGQLCHLQRCIAPNSELIWLTCGTKNGQMQSKMCSVTLSLNNSPIIKFNQQTMHAVAQGWELLKLNWCNFGFISHSLPIFNHTQEGHSAKSLAQRYLRSLWKDRTKD